jgi:hypothetical protein
MYSEQAPTKSVEEEGLFAAVVEAHVVLSLVELV